MDSQALRGTVSKQHRTDSNLNIHLEDPVFTKTNQREPHKATVPPKAVITKTLITDTNAEKKKDGVMIIQPNCWSTKMNFSICSGQTNHLTWILLNHCGSFGEKSENTISSFSISTATEKQAERKWHKSKDPSDLSIYQSLLSSFSSEVHTAKVSYIHNKMNSTSDTRNLFKTFNSLPCPTPPPPTSLKANNFVTFFTNKTSSISNQFPAPHTQDLKPTTSTDETHLFSFCHLTEAEVSKLLLSSHPQHVL